MDYVDMGIAEETPLLLEGTVTLFDTRFHEKIVDEFLERIQEEFKIGYLIDNVLLYLNQPNILKYLNKKEYFEKYSFLTKYLNKIDINGICLISSYFHVVKNEEFDRYFNPVIFNKNLAWFLKLIYCNGVKHWNFNSMNKIYSDPIFFLYLIEKKLINENNRIFILDLCRTHHLFSSYNFGKNYKFLKTLIQSFNTQKLNDIVRHSKFQLALEDINKDIKLCSYFVRNGVDIYFFNRWRSIAKIFLHKEIKMINKIFLYLKKYIPSTSLIILVLSILN